MKRQLSRFDAHRNTTMPYVTGEMSAIMEDVVRELDDPAISQCIHFSSTALTVARSVLMRKGAVIADTPLVQEGLNAALLEPFGIAAQCFLEDREVVAYAAQRHVTRAEVALDTAMTRVAGPKLFVIGSAPGMLGQLLQRSSRHLPENTMVIAAPNGFAGAVQLKEKLWDSMLPCIVVRGRSGGPAAAIAVFNALARQTSSFLGQ